MDEGWELFAIDPRGYEVFCSDSQLDYIYNHHPELRNFWATEDDMKIAIENAEFIYESIHGKEYHVYYRSNKSRNTELKVVVKFDKNNIGRLWAAQPSTVGRRNSGETILWTKANR